MKQVTWRRGVSSNARAEHVWRPSPLPTPAYESPPSSGNFASRADNAVLKHDVRTMELILRAPPIAELVGEHRSPLVHAASTATQRAAHTAARDTRLTVCTRQRNWRVQASPDGLPTSHNLLHQESALNLPRCFTILRQTQTPGDSSAPAEPPARSGRTAPSAPTGQLHRFTLYSRGSQAPH